MNVTVLGCGRWGSFLAWYSHKIGHDVFLWGRESDNLRTLQSSRKRDELELHEDITISSDLEAALAHSDRIIISISAQQLRNLMTNIIKYPIDKKTIILCMKGIEEDTGKRLTEIVTEYVPSATQIAIWVGPGHVQDFLKGIPNCMVIDSECDELKETLISEFSSKLIRFYYGQDIIGSEIGAASKNVIGIAAGMLDGFGYTSLKGALMSRGTREISKLIKAMGGNEFSAYGLCHLGDYEATVFSQYSHNRRFGQLYVEGKDFGKLAEGVPTAKALMTLSSRLGVELPICHAVYSIIYEHKDPEEILFNLFLRTQKNEF